MKYIIPENKLDNIVFRYLDNILKGLEKRKPKYYDGIVFAFPEKEYGMLGIDNYGTLYLLWELLDEISNGFSLSYSDSESVIGRWAEDRLNLEVDNVTCDRTIIHSGLGVDTN